MRKFLFVMAGIFLSVAMQAQGLSFLQESLGDNAVEAPSSNIDLLKKSLGNSDVAAPVSSVAAEKSNKKDTPKKTASKPSTPAIGAEKTGKKIHRTLNLCCNPL